LADPGGSFDPKEALDLLTENEVRFVVIGGIAAALHGSPSLTFDLDICHSVEEKNLERLAASLERLGARLRGAPGDVVFVLDSKSLEAARNLTLSTIFGALDCVAEPDGTKGFDEIAANAVEMDIGGTTVRVASLNDLIRMKRATGRPKDRIELEILGALRDEIERGAP
jgi:hypothetical protein